MGTEAFLDFIFVTVVISQDWFAGHTVDVGNAGLLFRLLTICSLDDSIANRSPLGEARLLSRTTPEQMPINTSANKRPIPRQAISRTSFFQSVGAVPVAWPECPLIKKRKTCS